MTRDEAIDQVLVELGHKPLMTRLLASTAEFPGRIAMQRSIAVSALALAARIVDALPLGFRPAGGLVGDDGVTFIGMDFGDDDMTVYWSRS